MDSTVVSQALAGVRMENELPARAALAPHGERWRPFRTVAGWYLWRGLDL